MPTFFEQLMSADALGLDDDVQRGFKPVETQRDYFSTHQEARRTELRQLQTQFLKYE